MSSKLMAEKYVMNHYVGFEEILQIFKLEDNEFILTISGHDIYWELPYVHNNDDEVEMIDTEWFRFTIEDVREFIVNCNENLWEEGINPEYTKSEIGARNIYQIAQEAQENYPISTKSERDLADFLEKLQEINWNDLLYRFEKTDLLSFVEYHIKDKR